MSLNPFEPLQSGEDYDLFISKYEVRPGLLSEDEPYLLVTFRFLDPKLHSFHAKSSVPIGKSEKTRLFLKAIGEESLDDLNPGWLGKKLTGRIVFSKRISKSGGEYFMTVNVERFWPLRERAKCES